MVKHLLDGNGQIMSANEIQGQYNVNVNFLHLLSLRHAISQEWKTVLRTDRHSSNATSIIDKILAHEKPSKVAYELLTASIVQKTESDL